MLEYVQPYLFVQMDNHLCVCARLEDMPALLETCAQFLEVVDFAVQNQPNCPIFVGDGLMSARNVQNAEPSHADAGAATRVMANIIGPAMFDHATHAVQERSQQSVGVIKFPYAVDSAHIRVNSIPSRRAHQPRRRLDNYSHVRLTGQPASGSRRGRSPVSEPERGFVPAEVS